MDNQAVMAAWSHLYWQSISWRQIQQQFSLPTVFRKQHNSPQDAQVEVQGNCDRTKLFIQREITLKKLDGVGPIDNRPSTD